MKEPIKGKLQLEHFRRRPTLALPGNLQEALGDSVAILNALLCN